MPQQKKNRRWALELAVAALLLLVVAFLLFRRSVYEPPAPPEPVAAVPVPVPAAPAPEQAVVLNVTGNVEKAHGGEWSPLAVGDRLGSDESIRTGKGGRTDLRIGDKSNLSVTESTQVTIRELTRAVHRFRLERGRLAVDYKPDGERVLKIENEGAVAETHGARFSVLSTGATVAVATETGSVNFKAADKEVVVGEGQTAVARKGEAPEAPEPTAAVPVALLLKVAAAIPAENEKVCTRVSGSVAAGSEVLVDGVPAALDAQGRFDAEVPRRPSDKKQVLVATRDPLGREQTRAIPCDPTDPRIHRLGIQWDEASP